MVVFNNHQRSACRNATSLHFGRNQSSLRAFTQLAQCNPPYKLLRTKGISPIERNVFMTNQNTTTGQRDIVDMHIHMAQPTEYYSTYNSCPGLNTHHGHASWLVKQLRSITKTMTKANITKCFRATCITTSLSEEDLPKLASGLQPRTVL